MKLTSFLSLILLSPNLLAFSIGVGDVCGIKDLPQNKDQRLCVCEVQAKENSNPKEYPFYKTGCQKWLAKQSCSQKVIVDQGDNIDHLFSDGSKEVLVMGYVGHWSGSGESIQYLEDRIEPIVDKFGVKVFYDNTACSGASDPVSMMNHISSLEPRIADNIILRANENISVGEWDSILRPFVKSNVPVTTCKDAIQVPRCEIYKDKNCSLFLNHKNTLGCVDKKNNFQVLKCNKKRESQKIKKISLGKWRQLDYSPKKTEIVTVSGLDVLKKVMPNGFYGHVAFNYEITETYEYQGETHTDTYIDSQTFPGQFPYELLNKSFNEEETQALREEYEEGTLEERYDYLGRNAKIQFLGVSVYSASSLYGLNLSDEVTFIDYGNSDLNPVISENEAAIRHHQEHFNPISNYYRYGDSFRKSNSLSRVLKEFLSK